jgi:predicted MFS family arabinose efflux permease
VTLLSQAIGPSVGEALIERWGWDALFVAGATFHLFAIVLTLPLPDPPRAVAPQEAPSVASVLRAPGILPPIATTLLAGGTFGAMLSFVPAYAEVRHLSQVRTFFIAYALTAVASRLVAWDLPDRVRRRAIIVPSLLVYATAAALGGFLEGLPGLAIAGTLFGLAQGLYYPALNVLVLDLAPAATRGRAMSLFNLAFVLGSGLGIFSYGALARAVGYPLMFAGIAVVTLVAAALLLQSPVPRDT